MTVSPSIDQTYILEGFKERCSAKDSVHLKVIQPIVAPYFFSPNGDEINDRWVVENILDYQEYSIKVFNRWGNKVFESSEDSNEWDGFNSSQTPATDGVYFYVIEASTLAGEVDLTGHFTLSK